jgi:hypothetical protein
VTEIEKAVAHASTLLREHCEKYVAEMHVEPVAWRRRYAEIREELDWLEFSRDYPLRSPLPPMPPFRHR